nr:biotin transporter BioY [uncultured Dethiosulfovibrio sp.]
MRISSRDMILIALFAGLTAVGAFIRIPIGPAPISLQNFFSLMAGALLGARSGALSQGIYVGIGLTGIPVFTSGGGLSYVMHPTFGFLLGFILCAWVVGRWMETREPLFRNFFIGSVMATALVYILGVPWLYVILTKVSGVDMSLLKAFQVGCLVFLPGDLVKIVGVSWLASKIVPRLSSL